MKTYLVPEVYVVAGDDCRRLPNEFYKIMDTLSEQKPVENRSELLES